MYSLFRNFKDCSFFLHNENQIQNIFSIFCSANGRIFIVLQNLSNVSKRLQVQSVLERRQLPDIHGRGPSVENREADSARSAAEIPHVSSSWSLAKRDLGLDQPRFAMAPLPKVIRVNRENAQVNWKSTRVVDIYIYIYIAGYISVLAKLVWDTRKRARIRYKLPPNEEAKRRTHT